MAASGALAYLGRRNKQQSDTPKHVHTVCIRLFTYIATQKQILKFDLVIAEVFTLAPPCLQGILYHAKTYTRTANFKHYCIATTIKTGTLTILCREYNSNH